MRMFVFRAHGGVESFKAKLTGDCLGPFGAVAGNEFDTQAGFLELRDGFGCIRDRLFGLKQAACLALERKDGAVCASAQVGGLVLIVGRDALTGLFLHFIRRQGVHVRQRNGHALAERLGRGMDKGFKDGACTLRHIMRYGQGGRCERAGLVTEDGVDLHQPLQRSVQLDEEA